MKRLLLFISFITMSFLLISCTKMTHTVSFNSDGGTNIDAQEVLHDEYATEPPKAPTKDGFIFKHWSFEGDVFIFSERPIRGDITLIAIWQVEDTLDHKFTITFNSDGGSDVSSVQVEDGALLTKPDDPTKTDFDFKGWYLDDTRFDFSKPITSHMTLKAHWDAKTGTGEYTKLSFLEGLLVLSSFEKTLIFNDTYEGIFEMQNYDATKVKIEGKIDLNKDYETRNSHVQIFYDENLFQEIYVVDGVYYAENFDYESVYTSVDILTDEHLGTLLNLPNPIETLNYYYEDFMTNFNQIDLIKNLKDDHIQVFRKDNTYKVVLKVLYEDMPKELLHNISLEFIEELQIEIYIEDNNISRVKGNLNIDNDAYLLLDIYSSDYELSFLDQFDPLVYGSPFDIKHQIIAHLGYDNIVQTYTSNPYEKTLYDYYYSGDLDFMRNGYHLKGIYTDKAMTIKLDVNNMPINMDEDQVFNLYYAWEKRITTVDYIDDISLDTQFFALETSSNPTDFEGIYKINEFIIFANVYQDFFGYAVIYDIKTDVFYAVNKLYEGYKVYAYDDIAHLALWIEDFMSLEASSFMKFGDFYMNLDKQVILDEDVMIINPDVYNLQYQSYYYNMYDDSRYLSFYETVQLILEENLEEIDIELTYIELDVHKYFYIENNERIYMFDKSTILEEIHLFTYDNVGFIQTFNLSQIDEERYTLHYNIKDNLEITEFELTIDDITIAFKAVLYDYETHGALVHTNRDVYYLKDIDEHLKIPSFAELDYFYARFNQYERVYNSVEHLKDAVSLNKHRLVTLEINLNFKTYDTFKDALNKSSTILIYDYDGEVITYYDFNSKTYFNDVYTLSFNNDSVLFKTLSFSISVPYKDFDIDSFIESIPYDQQDLFWHFGINDLIRYYPVFNGDLDGVHSIYQKSEYTFEDGNLRLYLHDTKYLATESFNFTLSDESVVVPMVETIGTSYTITSNLTDYEFNVVFDISRISYDTRFTYAPINYYWDEILSTDTNISGYYSDFKYLSDDAHLELKAPYVAYMELRGFMGYFDVSLESDVYVVNEESIFENIYIDYTYYKGNSYSMYLNNIEDLAFELNVVEDQVYELVVTYLDMEVSTYLYIIKKDSLEKVIISNKTLYHLDDFNMDFDERLVSLNYIRIINISGYFETVNAFKMFVTNSTHSIFIVDVNYELLESDEMILNMQSHIVQLTFEGLNLYIDYSNNMAYNEDFIIKYQDGLIIYQTKDVSYTFDSLEQFEKHLVENLIYEERVKLYYIGMIFDLLDHKYESHYEGYSDKRYYFDNSELSISIYNQFISLQIYGLYHGYLGIQTVDSAPTPEFGKTGYTYTIYNNVDTSKIVITTSDLSIFVMHFDLYEFIGIYDNDNYSGDILTNIPNQDSTLYYKFDEAALESLYIYAHMRFIPDDEIVDHILLDLQYVDGTYKSVVLMDLDPTTYELTYFIGENINESTITLIYAGIEVTQTFNVFDAGMGPLIYETKYVDLGGFSLTNYYYFDDIDVEIRDYMKLEGIYTQHEFFDSKEQFKAFVLNSDLKVFEIHVYYQGLENVDLAYELLSPDILSFYNLSTGQTIYYEHQTNTISTDDFVYYEDALYVYFESSYLYAKPPKNLFNESKLFDLIDANHVRIIKDIFNYKTIIYHKTFENAHYSDVFWFELNQNSFNIFVAGLFIYETYDFGYSNYYYLMPEDSFEKSEHETSGYHYTIYNNINGDMFEFITYDHRMMYYTYQRYELQHMMQGDVIIDTLPYEDATLIAHFNKAQLYGVEVTLPFGVYDMEAFTAYATFKEFYYDYEILTPLSQIDPALYNISTDYEESDYHTIVHFEVHYKDYFSFGSFILDEDKYLVYDHYQNQIRTVDSLASLYEGVSIYGVRIDVNYQEKYFDTLEEAINYIQKHDVKYSEIYIYT